MQSDRNPLCKRLGGLPRLGASFETWIARQQSVANAAKSRTNRLVVFPVTNAMRGFLPMMAPAISVIVP